VLLLVPRYETKRRVWDESQVVRDRLGRFAEKPDLDIDLGRLIGRRLHLNSSGVVHRTGFRASDPPERLGQLTDRWAYNPQTRQHGRIIGENEGRVTVLTWFEGYDGREAEVETWPADAVRVNEGPLDASGRPVKVGALVQVARGGMTGRVVSIDPDGTVHIRANDGTEQVDQRLAERIWVVPDAPTDPAAAAVYARFSDPATPNAAREIQDRLAAGDGSPEERKAWATALKMRDQAILRGQSWRVNDARLELARADNPEEAARRLLAEDLNLDERVALVHALELELRRRATGAGGMHYGRHQQLQFDRRFTSPTGGAGLDRGRFTREQVEALWAYIRDASINDRIRQGTLTDEDRAQIELIDSAMTPTVDGVIVFRGVLPSALPGFRFGEDDPSSLVGQVLTEPAYLSTNWSSNSGAFSELPIQLMIRVPAGTRAAELHDVPNAAGFASVGDEHELLLARGTRMVIHAAYYGPYSPLREGRYTVTGVERSDLSKTLFIEAEIVPADWEPRADWRPDPYGNAWDGYGVPNPLYRD
jgi:hypothetical protein